jgi:hypothetical protein
VGFDYFDGDGGLFLGEILARVLSVVQSFVVGGF